MHRPAATAPRVFARTEIAIIRGLLTAMAVIWILRFLPISHDQLLIPGVTIEHLCRRCSSAPNTAVCAAAKPRSLMHREVLFSLLRHA